MNKRLKLKTEINIMNVAGIVSNLPLVINSLANKKPGGEVQKFVEYILDNTERVDILVAADMNGIRYAQFLVPSTSHPVPFSTFST